MKIPLDMHPCWLAEKFENWTLDTVGGWRGTMLFGVGFFPAVWVSMILCLVPSYWVLCRGLYVQQTTPRDGVEGSK